MTSSYFLCAADDAITSCSRFYKVSVPSTKQGGRDRSFLDRYAKEHNYYWRVWDAETADFYAKIADSLNMRVYQMPTKRINARVLVAFIKEKKSLPPTREIAREAARLRESIEPNFHFSRISNVIHQAEAIKRNKPKCVEVEVKVSIPK